MINSYLIKIDYKMIERRISMEKRLNKKVQTYTLDMKNDIKQWIISNDILEKDNMNDLMSFIYDYKDLEITKDDIHKRKRTKNEIPIYERCCAKRANGQQCTRRKKGDHNFCGTHSNGNPNGMIHTSIEKYKVVEVRCEDINGIMNYIDSNHNIYKPSDILEKKENPRIISKWMKNENDEYCIVK